jgi:hypothetical protein
MVTEVGPETRKKLLQTKLKIGWLICNVGDSRGEEMLQVQQV